MKMPQSVLKINRISFFPDCAVIVKSNNSVSNNRCLNDEQMIDDNGIVPSSVEQLFTYPVKFY